MVTLNELLPSVTVRVNRVTEVVPAVTASDRVPAWCGRKSRMTWRPETGGSPVPAADAAVHAYLADVYVLADHRGRGLGEAMVRGMVERGELAGLRWLLHTRDAAALPQAGVRGAQPAADGAPRAGVTAIDAERRAGS